METAFTRLVGCRHPLQQAACGGFAAPELAAAVCEAGALGMLGAVMLPPAALDGALAALASRTAAPFGTGFLMPFLDRDAVAVAARRARVVEFFYGEPDPALVSLAKSDGALAGWQVGSLEEARAAEAAGCDFVIAQGTEAGGHIRGRMGMLPLLAQVLDAVSVPVVAAGGIGSARAMAAALAAGAAAVRVGTRFVAARESPAHPEYVAALVAARPEDTVLTEAFSVGWPDAPHRVLRSCVEEAERFRGDIVGEMELGGQKIPIERFAAPCPTRTTQGHVTAMALYAGESVGGIKGAIPAAEIVNELVGGAEALLRSLVGEAR